MRVKTDYVTENCKGSDAKDCVHGKIQREFLSTKFPPVCEFFYYYLTDRRNLVKFAALPVMTHKLMNLRETSLLLRIKNSGHSSELQTQVC